MLVLVVARDAASMPLFTSPPHFVPGDARQQIVFFLNETVEGALAVRRADDAVDVIVPGSRVDATIEGSRFADASTKIRGVVVAAGGNGATTIHIEMEGPTGEVAAQPLDDPPRLIVGLGTAKKPSAPRRIAAAAPMVAPVASVTATAVPEPSRTPAPAVLEPTPTATAAVESTATRTQGATVAPTPVAAAEPVSSEDPEPQGVRVVDALRGAGPPPIPSEPAAPAELVGALPCVWRRWHGVPFCAPDAHAAAYALDPETAAVAAALAASGGEVPAVATADTPARAYLQADVAYVTQASSGRMLRAIEAYRQALRRHADFVDAPRARLNIALAYRTMGFESELRAAAEAASGTEAGTLLRALAGDVALEAGALERARGDFAAVAGEGDLGACLSRRGRVALAVEGAKDEDGLAAARDLAAYCPRALVDDPETKLLLARVRLSAGDLAGTARLLTGLREQVPERSRARVIATQGAVAEAAGDRAAAQAAYAELASGAFGARAAQSAVARLALLDAADGDIEKGLQRLGTLGSAASGEARRQLVTQALATLDGAESASEVVALVHESRAAPASLPLAAQIELARAYRTLGLHARAADVLRAAERGSDEPVPTAWWAESARAAQAEGGWPAVVPITERWLAARPGTPEAEGLRAQAFAATGKVDSAVEALARAATRLEPSGVRDLRIEVALLLRPHDPRTTQQLLEEAATADVQPALPAERAAMVLWELGDVAETNGDVSTARAVFAQLVRRYPDAPAATLAAYRQGRLAAPERSVRAYDQATAARDGLERRAAEAARDYEAIMATLGSEETR